MRTKAKLGVAPHQMTGMQEAEFQQPANCPLASCPAITSGNSELERLRLREAELRKAFAREQLLLD